MRDETREFIETRYHFRSLTARDAAANNMLDGFDFGEPPQPPLILQPHQCPRSRLGSVLQNCMWPVDRECSLRGLALGDDCVARFCYTPKP
jgi:hypothetical protein